jgi:hypothetical protein
MSHYEANVELNEVSSVVKDKDRLVELEQDTFIHPQYEPLYKKKRLLIYDRL